MRLVVSSLALATALGSGLACGCAHHEPPQVDRGDASLAVAPIPSAYASALASSHDRAAREGLARDGGSVDGGEVDVDGTAPAALEPGALPQTRDRPEPTGPAFDARVAALWDAIARDDPARAMPFFFPLAAYEKVKAIEHPARDWKLRLVAAYTRDIHDLHLRLGAGAAQAKLSSADVPMAKARWVEPGEEYNKIGYYRVFGTRLHGDVGGRAIAVDVTSLISWRGEWYCVHLSSVK